MSVERAAVFLDRDGTINVDYGYVHQKDKLTFIDGSIEALRIFQKCGYLLIIVTNQSGVARGYFSIDELEEFHRYMLEILKENKVVIDAVYYCPHLEGCNCRKPKLGLFYQAQKEFGIDFSKSYVIGDNMRDLSLCEAESVKGILLSDKKFDEKGLDNILICRNLLQAAHVIADRYEE